MSQATTTTDAATLSPRDATSMPRDTSGTITRVRSRSRLLRPVLMLGGIAVVIVGAVYYWLNSGQIMSTDDAYVQADRVALSTDVSGLVGTIDVKSGEVVKRGQLLFSLDKRQFQIALDGAKANLAQTVLDLNAMKADYGRMQSDAAVRAAMVQSDQADFSRYAALVRGGGVTRQEYDNARFKLAADKQALDATQETAATQLARLGGNAHVDVTTLPAYKQAAARVDEAQRQLDDAVVRAPFDGIVTRVSKLQPGMYLSASTAAFGLVSTDHVWIAAEPKETQLTWVRPGQKVNISVDAYPGRVWKGTVEVVAPASDSEFSVLPAQNSSGNWVKVVQRIPLRVHVERAAGDPPLTAGMSVVIDVDTGHVRHLSDLF